VGTSTSNDVDGDARISQSNFEMDCKMVVDDVHNKKQNNSEYGSLIDDCRTIFSNHSDFIVAFTRCQANGSAHALARATLPHASHATFDVIPNCIITILQTFFY
jgi:hypothetical protein